MAGTRGDWACSSGSSSRTKDDDGDNGYCSNGTVNRLFGHAMHQYVNLEDSVKDLQQRSTLTRKDVDFIEKDVNRHEKRLIRIEEDLPDLRTEGQRIERKIEEETKRLVDENGQLKEKLEGGFERLKELEERMKERVGQLEERVEEMSDRLEEVEVKGMLLEDRQADVEKAYKRDNRARLLILVVITALVVLCC
ncbi:hypothetical protein CC1G_08480 [Coprinopsis cinerea okayama7|uniref:Uncharacterized protein n=1 Tax=Coprinopsis cinerea (strain Okayama-7 / 130 / ATCC MYA-4618 / FGSC 9003) TaxID=240176 RepID=A8NM34_COPC7|nr:hypothetical protein CC1G_08480 [Coprinopsis cinerea okayama7\|eukprot:XP_001834835.2 hypothetical protein CC1G_08480 [Coprinopsis cinerea okayama7\